MGSIPSTACPPIRRPSVNADGIVVSIEDQTNNSVTNRGFYIELLISGPQTTDTFKLVNSQLETIAADFTAKNKPILVLTMLANMPTKLNPGALKESLKPADTIQFKRFAISGPLPHLLMSIIDGVINSFEKSFEVKYFPDKDQAVLWLKDYKP